MRSNCVEHGDDSSSPVAVAQASQVIVLSIIRMVTASISLTSSIVIIWMISRTATKFSSTQHRLLLGMSITDILSSLAQTLSSIPMPRGTANVWLALGTIGTCKAQAFIIVLGSLLTPSYNAGLCIFFWLKVKYNLSDDTIRNRVEPLLHGVPIAIAMAVTLTSLQDGRLGPELGICFLVRDRSDSDSTDLNDPCEKKSNPASRGRGSWQYFILAAIVAIITPLVIFSTMISMYLSVRHQEGRMARFGRGSLSLSATPDSNARDTFGRSSQNVRQVMKRGLTYSGAWFITYIFPTIFLVFQVSGNEPGYVIRVLCSIFHPLQGLFNFMTFIYPKVCQIRQLNPDYSLWKSCFCAIISNEGEILRMSRDRRRLSIMNEWNVRRVALHHDTTPIGNTNEDRGTFEPDERDDSSVDVEGREVATNERESHTYSLNSIEGYELDREIKVPDELFSENSIHNEISQEGEEVVQESTTHPYLSDTNASTFSTNSSTEEDETS